MLLSKRATSMSSVLSTLGFTSALLFCSVLPATTSWALEARGGTPQDILTQTSAAFNQVATKATPAVVSISAIKSHGDPEESGGNPHNPFGMPDPQGGLTRPPNAPSFGIGSGVVIRADGIILTNNHVVSHADRVTVVLDDKRQMKAKVLGSDPKTDIAVVQIIAPAGTKLNLPTIELGNSDQVKVGDWAVAIGSPFGLSHTVTSGIISAKGRGQMGVLDTEDFIQTDAAINPGNSGGPLLNLNSQMIGLNAAIFSQTGGFVGIGFSIPSNLVHKIADEIIAHGKITRGYLGLLTQDIDGDLATYFKVPLKKGALISQVTLNGPAAKAHAQIGDVVTRYDGKMVNNSTELKDLVSKSHAGSKVPVEVVRDGKTQALNVTVLEQPGEGFQQAGQVSPATVPEKPSLGLTLQDIPPDFKSLGLSPTDGALIVGVRPGSKAFDSGLMPGDIIVKANGTKISNSADFVKFSKKMDRDGNNVLYVQRGLDRKFFIPLKNEA
ncbi:MAG: Do family serine endopeptidase [Methylotenera sp.]|nr:Do family serine endopeptidase [Oligoflexia bacterium]